MNAFLLVGTGGALGAMSRYGTGVIITRIWGAVKAMNFINKQQGALARFTPLWQGDARLFVAVGFLGGFTTFSSFSLDVVMLVQRGDTIQAALYTKGSNL